ncbi:hypothetical protein BX600DRAFT_516387 [Xylariales sp. PMI_506]|nr:hypothetical protein BX600DRAFT_516387 [Xylariales sp. PMI_506]
MDDNARRRRQNEQPISATSNPRYPVHDPNAQRRAYGATPSASDRYRPAPLNTSPASARGMGSSAAYSGYYQESPAAFSTPIAQSTIPYQSEYGQDTRQTQNFGAYNASMMYNVPQTSAQNTVYDAAQQFPSRQPAAMHIMSTEVAAPYFPSEAANTTPATGLQGQTASSSASAVYQQSPADQRAMLQTYPSGMASMSGMSQTSAPEQIIEEQEYSASAEMGEAYEAYQSALKEIFTNIRSGVLVAASESLLNVSDWLLSKVSELGLTADNQQLHNERLKLWHDFNTAWLGLFQKQKDMVESGAPPQRGQSLISEDGLRKMGQELIRLCDSIERHGLVDYEYGVWEEHIVSAIEDCLDLCESSDEAGPSGSSAGNPPSTSHHGSR